MDKDKDKAKKKKIILRNPKHWGFSFRHQQYPIFKTKCSPQIQLILSSQMKMRETKSCRITLFKIYLLSGVRVQSDIVFSRSSWPTHQTEVKTLQWCSYSWKAAGCVMSLYGSFMKSPSFDPFTAYGKKPFCNNVMFWSCYGKNEVVFSSTLC